MLKWLFGQRGRGGKSLSVDFTFALIFNTNVLVLWYIGEGICTALLLFPLFPFDVISNRGCDKPI